MIGLGLKLRICPLFLQFFGVVPNIPLYYVYYVIHSYYMHRNNNIRRVGIVEIVIMGLGLAATD